MQLLVHSPPAPPMHAMVPLIRLMAVSQSLAKPASHGSPKVSENLAFFNGPNSLFHPPTLSTQNHEGRISPTMIKEASGATSRPSEASMGVSM